MPPDGLGRKVREREPTNRESGDRDVKLVRELWYILNRRERIEGFILLCAMALGALFEAISIGLVVPLIAVLKEPELLFRFSGVGTLFSFLNIHQPRQMLTAVGLGLICIFVIKSVYLVLLCRWQFRYIFATEVRLGRRLLTGYLTVSYTFHLQHNSAELIKTMTDSVRRFTGGFLLSLLMVLGEILIVLAVIVLLMLVEPLATLGAMLVLGVPTALMYLRMRHRLAIAGRTTEQSYASMLQWIEQAIGGIKETLVTGHASFFIDRYGYHNRRLADSMRTLTFLSSIPRLVIDTLTVSAMVAFVLIVLAGGQNLQTIAPVLTLFAMAAIRLMPLTSHIANALAQLRFHYAATEVVYKELVKTEGYGLERFLPGRVGIRSAPFVFERSLVLEHVSYHYPSMPLAAIHDISLEIPKGHWIGLIGPTGAGKTTLVDLILGLFAPTSGRILVDGRDLQDDIAGWQRNIGYVPQDIYLLDDSVRRNVAFGVEDEEINDERVWRALRAAQVDRFIRSLADGLDTIIGERGDRISGGERQRLGIARALYRDPQVLVLDEGTAHLDNETEAAIAHTLTALRGEKTIIVVAHRLALVTNCDQVYLLKDGRVRNSGAYSKLISTDSAVQELSVETSSGL